MRVVTICTVLLMILVGCAPKEQAPVAAAPEPAAPSPAPAAPVPADPTSIAKQVVTNLSSGNVAGVTAKFDSTMKTALPESQLSAVWNDLTAKLGPYKAQAGTRVEQIQGFTVVFVTTEFEHGKVDVQVTLDNTGQITGLFIKPPAGA